MSVVEDPPVFVMESLPLERGGALYNARLVYKCYGRLNKQADNAVLYPTWFMGTHTHNEWLIGPGRALDPEHYFIVVPNMIGNGVSTSPSNTDEFDNGAAFPDITVRDQVLAQWRLLTEHLGVRRLALALGWSMGACQTYQWAVSYPEMVDRIMPFCGSARTTEHNHVFLDGVVAAIQADGAWADGKYQDQPTRGLRAAARVYAGWGFSQAFYWHRAYQALGFSSYSAFVEGFWEPLFMQGRDANDLLSMIKTWKSNDVGATPGFDGNLECALGSIKAKTLVMAAERDLYFCVEDEAWEASKIPQAEFSVIPGIWGHSAGVGLNETDTIFIDEALRGLLAR